MSYSVVIWSRTKVDIYILQEIDERYQLIRKLGQNLGEWFPPTKGNKQGNSVSPSLLTVYLERLMDKILKIHMSNSFQREKFNFKFKKLNLILRFLYDNVSHKDFVSLSCLCNIDSDQITLQEPCILSLKMKLFYRTITHYVNYYFTL